MSTNTIEFRPVEISIEIPTSKVAFAQAKLVKLNKRLAKLGAPAAAITLGEIRQVEQIDEGGFTLRWNVQQVTVSGVEANLGGWTFVASLDHTVGEHENLVSRFPGHEDDELPLSLRTAEPVCEHCGLQRGRNVTLILRNEAGELKQIGKACAAEYLGIDPTNALNLSYAIREFEDDDEFRIPNYNQPPTDYFLAVAFEAVRAFGFNKSRCDDPTATPTVQTVWSIVNGGQGRAIVDSVEDYNIDRGAAEAAKAIEWVLGSDDTSDYIHNLRLAVRNVDVHPKTAGLLASLPAAYARAIGKVAEAAARREAEEARKATAEPVPVTDKRIRIEGVIVHQEARSTQWGTAYKLIVLDDRGFKVWGGEPSSISAEIGDRIAFDAKVERSDRDELFGFYSRPTKVVHTPQVAA